MTPALLERAREAVLDIPVAVFLRAGDTCTARAQEHGCREVYTNDRRMLTAVRCVELTGVNVLDERDRGRRREP